VEFLRGILILFLFLWFGELIVSLSSLPLPGSVLGMILLFLGLKIGVVKLKHVEGTARGLLDILNLLFVPPGVGIMLYFGLLKRELIPISVAVFLSTFIVMGGAALAAGWSERKRAHLLDKEP